MSTSTTSNNNTSTSTLSPKAVSIDIKPPIDISLSSLSSSHSPSALNFDSTKLRDFKDHSKTILNKLNDLSVKDTLGRTHKPYSRRTSLMYLVTRCPDTKVIVVSVGHMSRAGSYIPAYNKFTEINDYIKNDMGTIFGTLHDEYTLKNPSRRVLYLRYNSKYDTLEMFNSGNCVLSSRVFSDE